MIPFTGRRYVDRSVSFAALLLVGGCAPAVGASVTSSEAEQEALEPVVVTVFTDQVELFMEYPRLVPGHEARFLAHVTVLASGEPVRSGELRLELSRGSAAARVLEAPRPARDGLFIPVGTFETPSTYEARIVVTSPQVRATIPLPPVVVHADLASAQRAAVAEAVDEPPDVVPFLLEQQWKIGLLLHTVEPRTLTRRLRVPGEIEAPHNGQAVVSAPLAGRLLPPEAGSLPQLGERVEQGQVLGQLEPPLTTSDTAQLVANETYHDTLELELLIREFDVRAKTLEGARALQQGRAQLAFAERAQARLEDLRAKDLGTVAELEEARRDVELARRANEGSVALEAALTGARDELETLRARGQALRSGAASSLAPRPHALVAPISGVIVGVEHVAGEHVESQGAIYRLLDLRQVWITAHVSEFDLAALGEAPGALLQLAALPNRTFDVVGELQGRLIDSGRVVDPETRTIALRYEATNPDGQFRSGLFADVFLETGRAVEVVAIPEQAIVQDNGRPIAFVLIHGEAFQKRDLELGIRDGRFVEVRAGLRAGERVVTEGAYLVKLAAASPASFGEGHAH